MRFQISQFPKIFAVGTRNVKPIFDSPVEVTEKIDGSQFAFGSIDGEFYVRSKGQQIFVENAPALFQQGVEVAHDRFTRGLLPDNHLIFAEYLQKPHHNTLSYNRIPKNHIIVFGVWDLEADMFQTPYAFASLITHRLELEIIPVLHTGMIDTFDQIKGMLSTESVLGGEKIEGVVIKNYDKSYLIGDRLFPIMCAKYVTEAFKERHHKGWKKKKTTQGGWEAYVESYHTDARWLKAVQHFRDSDQLQNAPQDIGPLLKEIQNDIVTENIDDIKDALWKLFGKDLLRNAVRGFPEWYKEYLAKGAFPLEETTESA